MISVIAPEKEIVWHGFNILVPNHHSLQCPKCGEVAYEAAEIRRWERLIEEQRLRLSPKDLFLALLRTTKEIFGEKISIRERFLDWPGDEGIVFDVEATLESEDEAGYKKISEMENRWHRSVCQILPGTTWITLSVNVKSPGD